ncbi:MAG: MltA domain-containing protein [Planctomycetota bacterium]|nr:MltA domain-containing protein [Planctomycetota bacterium]
MRFSRRRTPIRLIALPLAFYLLAACHHQAPTTPTADFHRQLPDGMVALRKIPLEEYPDFGAQPIDPNQLSASINNSLKYLATPTSQSFFPYLDITHDRAVATLMKLSEICSAMTSPSWDGPAFNAQIRQDFEVYKSVGAPAADGSGYTDRVLFTGYYTPIYDASATRTEQFHWPLYKLPTDLVRDPRTGQVSGRKTTDGQTVPYYTRGEIETGGKLAGSELVWLKSRWEAYIVTVQGSAILRMTDTGQLQGVGFAGTNGYTYTSPGRQMVTDGVITTDQLTLRGLAQFFAAHPEMMDRYLPLNQRYVFFTQHSGPPVGSLNVPVTPMTTVATDKDQKDIYPRAMPAFLTVPIPNATGTGVRPFTGFMLDQDTGGAIRASGRCDIYMGIGPSAEAMAGQELQEGALYYLALRPELMLSSPPQAK